MSDEVETLRIRVVIPQSPPNEGDCSCGGSCPDCGPEPYAIMPGCDSCAGGGCPDCMRLIDLDDQRAAGPEGDGSASTLPPSCHNRHTLWEEVKNVTQLAMDAAHGTDPRHGLLGRAVADAVAFEKPLPWGLGQHFGRTVPTAEQEEACAPTCSPQTHLHCRPDCERACGCSPDERDHTAVEVERDQFRSWWENAERVRAQVERILDGVLGTEVGDGAGAGLAADVQLALDKVRAAALTGVVVPAAEPETVDGQANDCTHTSATGIDTTSPRDPAKVWACDHCGLRWRTDGARPVAADEAGLSEAIEAECARLEAEDPMEQWGEHGKFRAARRIRTVLAAHSTEGDDRG